MTQATQLGSRFEPVESRAHHLLGSVFIVVLGGYLFFDKTFAWIHVPGVPAFAGEVLIAVGLSMALLGHIPVRRSIVSSTPLRVLLVLVVLGGVRILWDAQSAGIDAARDGAVIYYAIVAFIAAALVWRSDPQWERMLTAYRWGIPVFLVWAPVGMVLSGAFGESVPTVPDSSTTWLDFKPGNFTVHIAAAIAFLWLVDPPTSHRRVLINRVLTGIGLVGIVVGASLNRGGGLAALMILAGVLFLSPHRVRALYSWILLAVGIGFLVFLLDVNVDLGRREISLEQLAANLESVVTPEEADRALAGTAQWRLDFWSDIADDALFGDRMVFGWGFGPNLADIYGYNTVPVGADGGLRSAHNSHMSVLGRLGVPGLAAWGLFWLTWLLIVAHASRSSRRMHSPRDGMLLGWLLLAVSGFLIAAIFDPMLESPQVAVWVWFLAGAAIGLMLEKPKSRWHRGEYEVAGRGEFPNRARPSARVLTPSVVAPDPGRTAVAVAVEDSAWPRPLGPPPEASVTNSSAREQGDENDSRPVRVNVADEDRLAELPGIGVVLAEAIVSHRSVHGPFWRLEDLLAVRGIGESKLEALRDLIDLR